MLAACLEEEMMAREEMLSLSDLARMRRLETVPTPCNEGGDNHRKG